MTRLLPLLFPVIISSKLGWTVRFCLPMGRSLIDGLRGQRCVTEAKGGLYASVVLGFIQQSPNYLLTCYSRRPHVPQVQSLEQPGYTETPTHKSQGRN